MHLTGHRGLLLLVLAFLAIRSYLREAGKERWSILQLLPFIVVGGTLFAVPPGTGVRAAGSQGRRDAETAQTALALWFISIMATRSPCGRGLAFAKGIANNRDLSRRLNWVSRWSAGSAGQLTYSVASS